MRTRSWVAILLVGGIGCVGCGGSQKKSGGGGGETVEQDGAMNVTSGFDLAAKDLAKQAAPKKDTLGLIRIGMMKNQSGDTTFDIAAAERKLADELVAAGLKVKPSAHSAEARDVAEERGYEEAMGGASEMDSLQAEEKATHETVCLITRERTADAMRYTYELRIVDVKTNTATISSKTMLEIEVEKE